MCYSIFALVGAVPLYAKVVIGGECICSMPICYRRRPTSIVARRIERAGAASKGTTGHHAVLLCVFVLAVVIFLSWVF